MAVAQIKQVERPAVGEAHLGPVGQVRRREGIEIALMGQGALQAYGLAHEVLQELVDRYSDVPDYERDLAQVLRAIASAQAHPELKQWDDAAANMDEAEKILKRLVDRYPTNKDYQLQLEDTRAGIVQLGKMRKPDGR